LLGTLILTTSSTALQIPLLNSLNIDYQFWQNISMVKIPEPKLPKKQ
jgi:hypothetical protein